MLLAQPPTCDASVPLRERHLEFADGERLPDRNLVRRILIAGIIRAHRKFAARDNDHLWAHVRAVAEFLAGTGRSPRLLFGLQRSKALALGFLSFPSRFGLRPLAIRTRRLTLDGGLRRRPGYRHSGVVCADPCDGNDACGWGPDPAPGNGARIGFGPVSACIALRPALMATTNSSISRPKRSWLMSCF